MSDQTPSPEASQTQIVPPPKYLPVDENPKPVPYRREQPRTITAQLRQALGEENGVKARAIANKMLSMAQEGDAKMVKLVLDRTEGPAGASQRVIDIEGVQRAARAFHRTFPTATIEQIRAFGAALDEEFGSPFSRETDGPEPEPVATVEVTEDEVINPVDPDPDSEKPIDPDDMTEEQWAARKTELESLLLDDDDDDEEE